MNDTFRRLCQGNQYGRIACSNMSFEEFCKGQYDFYVKAYLQMAQKSPDGMPTAKQVQGIFDEMNHYDARDPLGDEYYNEPLSWDDQVFD